MGLIAAIVVCTVGGGLIYVTGGLATPWIAPWLGFSSTGIVAGSWAAAAQSFFGNVAAGSIIALLTAAIMSGR